ncbi:MAG: hypothetical protein GX594_11150 [Pirellulaceae bacterium]|nr:hypothetical protein [Pirellulaceae bacterium]
MIERPLHQDGRLGEQSAAAPQQRRRQDRKPARQLAWDSGLPWRPVLCADVAFMDQCGSMVVFAGRQFPAAGGHHFASTIRTSPSNLYGISGALAL